jgi:hypothetical protein
VNSFKSTVIRQGYKLAGLFPWSLKMFLQRYSGFYLLTKEDFDHISKHFYEIVLIAMKYGVVHNYDIRKVLTDDWCRGISIKSTSRDQRHTHALEILKRYAPTEEIIDQ